MTFTAVVTAHDHDVDGILDDLDNQSRRPDQVLLYHSGDVKHRGYRLFWDRSVNMLETERLCVETIKVDNKNDWGHLKRDMGAREAKCDYIGFFNADDRYDPMYIERMMAMAEINGSGLVYCYWHPMGACTPTLGSSTSGNFIVHRDVARDAGYWFSRRYEADGDFIEAAVAASHRADRPVGRVPEVLYWHNAR